MSAGRSSLRRWSPARAVWLPATPTKQPASFSAWRHGPGVGVEVGLVQGFADAGVDTLLAFGVEVEARAEDLEDVAVVLAAGDDRAEHGGEGVAGDAEPVGPGAVLAGLIDEDLADVEPHGADRHGAAPSESGEGGKLLVEGADRGRSLPRRAGRNRLNASARERASNVPKSVSADQYPPVRTRQREDGRVIGRGEVNVAEVRDVVPGLPRPTAPGSGRP